MNPHPLNILVVEDEDDFRENLRKLLQENFPGSHVEEAASVREGRELLDRKDRTRLDIVILDFRLPLPNGGQEIDTSLCRLVRERHPDSLVIHVTAKQDHPLAVQHMREVHSPWMETTGGCNRMETQHLGIVIAKNFPGSADVEDPQQARRLGREIRDAVAKRVQLKEIEAGLDAMLGGLQGFAAPQHGTGRVAVPDLGVTGQLAGLSLALEEAWSWLPQRTQCRARSLFAVREISDSPGHVHLQLL